MITRRILTSALTTVVLCCSGLLTKVVLGAEPAPAEPKPKTIEELKKAIQGVLEKHGAPGAGIALVSKDGILWVGGVGKADLAAKKEVTEDTQFRTGSISKSFVALALLKLQEEGKIDLKAKLMEVAPEIAVVNPWEATHPVLVENLLEHTAGFDDMQLQGAYNTADPPDISLREVFAKFPGPQHVRWPPGTRMAYSNPGYGVAGYLIEKVTGQPFEDYIQEAILTPLGMQNSSFRLTAANRALLARGYKGKPPEPVAYKHIYLEPAGDFKSSPKELALLVQMFLNRGQVGEVQLVRPESIARMEIPETTLGARAGLRFGYGLGNYASLELPLVTQGHEGGIEGFVSSYRYLREGGVGYVVLLNSTVSEKPMEEISRLVFDYLTMALPKPAPPRVALSEAELEKFEGYYEPASPRNQRLAFVEGLTGGRTVFEEGGKLYQKALFKSREELIPVSATQFRLEKEPEASVVFCEGEDGKKVMTGFAYRERVSPWWPHIRVGLLMASLALMVTSLLFALVWIPRKLLGRMKEVRHLWVRAVPLLAALALVAIVFLMQQMDFTDMTSANLKTITLWALTWLFPLLSVGGLVLAARSSSREVRRGVRIHSLLVALGCTTVAAFFFAWGLVGVRIWTW